MFLYIDVLFMRGYGGYDQTKHGFKEGIMQMIINEKAVLERTIAECNEMLLHLDDDPAMNFEVVDLAHEFRMALEKKDRSLNGTVADIGTYFSEGAQELMGRGEACKFYIGERNIIYALEWEGNERCMFVTPGSKIEAQDMERFTFESFPGLSKGLYALLDNDNEWRISALYGFDYFLCGKDIVLRGTKRICDEVVEIIRNLGVQVETRPLDKAWLIFEPEKGSE